MWKLAEVTAPDEVRIGYVDMQLSVYSLISQAL